jgi:hypothetical protein
MAAIKARLRGRGATGPYAVALAARLPDTAITRACSLEYVVLSVGLATPLKGWRHVKQVLQPAELAAPANAT